MTALESLLKTIPKIPSNIKPAQPTLNMLAYVCNNISPKFVFKEIIRHFDKRVGVETIQIYFIFNKREYYIHNTSSLNYLWIKSPPSNYCSGVRLKASEIIELINAEEFKSL